MSYLKLIFNFIKYLIIKNPLKILFLVASITVFNFAGTLPGSMDYVDLVSETKDGNTYVYVVKERHNESGYGIISTNEKQVIKNNQLGVWNYHDGNVVLWVSFAILSIIVIICTFIPEDDINWDIEECYQRGITTLIYCELEGDTYYYMIMGRLIEKRKDQIRYTTNLAREMRIFNMSDIFRLPRFSTKTQKRNNILNKLGIN